ncbi:hypothetical protein J7L68_08870 [bacterium]|nr:hypothetical protein [bacterium]
MTKKKSTREEPKKINKKNWHSEKHLSLNSTNYILLVIGVVSIIVGFIFLELEFLTLSPIFLILGFCVFIPASILMGINSNSDTGKKTKKIDNKVKISNNISR